MPAKAFIANRAASVFGNSARYTRTKKQSHKLGGKRQQHQQQPASQSVIKKIEDQQRSSEHRKKSNYLS